MSRPDHAALTAQRLAMLARGYRPVPIAAGRKYPTVDAWQRIAAEATADTVPTWPELWPDHPGTGVLCGAVLGLDIDVADEALSDAIELAAMEHLGATQLRRVGRAPRVLLVYRAADPGQRHLRTPKFTMPDGEAAQVEVRAAGQQFVAFGIHPDTGQPYTWAGVTPEDVPAASLPVAAEADILAFLEVAEALIRAAGGSSSHKGPRRGAAPTGPRSMSDLAPPSADAVLALLNRMPNPEDTDRDAWVAVMLAAKGCIDALKAAGQLGEGENEAIRDAAVAWAGRWPHSEGEGPELEKWEADFAKRSAPLAGWHSLETAACRLIPGYREEQAAAEFAAVPLPELAAPLPAKLFFPADCTLDSGRGYVIKHLVAPGDVCALLGQPSAGKSTLAPHLAYAVAQGRPVFGLRTKHGRTLYAAAEDTAGFRQRMLALREEYGDAPDFAGMECGNLRDPAKVAELRAAVAAWRPALIVLDTIGAAFGGIDENSSAEMGAVVALARELAATGAAVLLIHHPAKHGDGTPRGHSVLNGTLDMVLTIAPEDGKDPDTIVRGALLKNRNGTTGREFAFRKRVVELGQDREGDAITTTLPVELDGDAAAARAPKMPRRQAVALQALRDALAGTEAEMRGGRAVVSDAAWRRVCDARSLTSSDKPESRARIFNQAAGDLAATELVMREDGYSWLAEGGGGFPVYSPDKTDMSALVRLSAPGKAGQPGRTDRTNPLGLSVSALSGSP